MSKHKMDSLEFDGVSSHWTAICTCHNPDGDGVGRADFDGQTAFDAYLAWEDHAAGQPDDLVIPTGAVYARDVEGDSGVAVSVKRYQNHQGSNISIGLHGIGFDAHAWVTDAQWNEIRGAR
jgi:hypothetical protein